MNFKDRLAAGLTPRRLGLLIVLAIAAWRVYEAPADYDLGDPAEQAVRVGAKLAADILDGETDAVKRFVRAGDQATGKLAKALPDFSDVVVSEAIEKSALPRRDSHWEPVTSRIYAEGRDEARIPVRLRTFEHLPGVYVMTFVGLSGRALQNNVQVQGVPMMASVFVRHVVDKDDYEAHRVLGRKIANAFWMHEYGVMGQWLLIDFEYNFNRRTYFDYVLANAEQLARETKVQNEELMKDLPGHLNNVMKGAEIELAMRYEWASKRMQQQQAFVATSGN